MFRFLLSLLLFTSLIASDRVPMGRYVGQLQERWQFPSDHLPIGMRFDQINIASWNVLDTQYIDWIIKKDTQGLQRSLIGDENIAVDESPLTLRDHHNIDLILQMLSHATHPKNLIALQECGPAFLKELHSKLPWHYKTISDRGETLIVDENHFEILTTNSIKGIFLDEPERCLQAVYLRSKYTGETIRILNVHLPGDPTKPARFEFAQYLADSFDWDVTTLALGDMNFNEVEMSEALETAFTDSPFAVYSPYCTNISPYIFKSKAIDHFIFYSPTPRLVEILQAEEVVPGLETTRLLLTLPSIEDSIMPLIEKAEDLSSLSKRKYSKNQFKEIETALAQKQDRIRLVTFNMLCDDYDPNKEEVHRWHNRLPRILGALEEMNPDLIGSQELSQLQLDDLKREIGDTYSFFGKIRSGTEYNGIFYRKDRFEVIGHEIMKIPGIRKDNSLTLLELKDLQTNKSFALYNIHMTYSHVNYREVEARYIANQMGSQELPSILAGDLNTFPQRHDLKHLPFYDGDYIQRILTQNGIKNAQEISLLGHVGPLSTFTNLPPSRKAFQGTGTPGVVLDHIYVSPGISVLIHATQPVKIDQQFPSDHMPVLIDFLIQ